MKLLPSYELLFDNILWVWRFPKSICKY